jgi:hypothetical protein
MAIDIKRVCIHECCHAVVARLFRQRMSMDGLVVNTGLIKGGEDHGVLNVNGPPLRDEHDFTALAITLLAGVVGENIYLLGIDEIQHKKEEIIADNKIMNWSMAGGDLPSFHYTAFAFRIQYGIDEYKLKEFCLGFLIDFLTDIQIWCTVEKLCDELFKKKKWFKKKDLKLSEKELEAAFKQIGLDALLDDTRKGYLHKCDEILLYCQRSA